MRETKSTRQTEGFLRAEAKERLQERTTRRNTNTGAGQDVGEGETSNVPHSGGGRRPAARVGDAAGMRRRRRASSSRAAAAAGVRGGQEGLYSRGGH
jgi:hypothetical protein